MSIKVRTNMSSMRSAHLLGRTTRGLGDTLSKVSSGLRITRAADDAAGAGVATNLDTAVISSRQAIRNTTDGMSVLQTAEGTMAEATDILQRLRELAVQSASSTLSGNQRAYIQEEFGELKSEMARLAQSTEYNGIKLSDGTVTTISVQVGISNATSSRVDIELFDMSVSSLSLGASSVGSVIGARNAMGAIDRALDTVSRFRSNLGALQNRLDAAFNNSSLANETRVGATGQIQNADYAYETAQMTRLQIMQQSGVAALAQAKNMNQTASALIQ